MLSFGFWKKYFLRKFENLLAIILIILVNLLYCRWKPCWIRQFVLWLVCSLEPLVPLSQKTFCGFGGAGDLHHTVMSISAKVNSQTSQQMMNEDNREIGDIWCQMNLPAFTLYAFILLLQQDDWTSKWLSCSDCHQHVFVVYNNSRCLFPKFSFIHLFYFLKACFVSYIFYAPGASEFSQGIICDVNQLMLTFEKQLLELLCCEGKTRGPIGQEYTNGKLCMKELQLGAVKMLL